MLMRFFIFGSTLLGLGFTAGGVSADGNTSGSSPLNLAQIEEVALPPVDPEKIRAEDEKRAAQEQVPHFAVAHKVEINPWAQGDWEAISQHLARWRLRVTSEGALSLNLAFRRFQMPAGGQMTIYSADNKLRIGPFTSADNEEHGELWTPPMQTDDLVIELVVPFDQFDRLEIELSKVHHGYAGFGEPEPKSGDCHRDVCSEAGPWSDPARSVALIAVEGVRFCTGFLINNTALDGRPFFMTAYHCGITARTAPSVVVIWNHESSTCGTEGVLDEVAGQKGIDPLQSGNFQTGASLRAAHRDTDMLLLELDDTPKPEFSTYYAGWDRTNTAPDGSVVIHHPNTDVKRISYDFDPALTTPHLNQRPLAEGNHLRVGDWNLGTTEGGSSGAPLFNRDRRVVGQLHGGYAACGNQQPDWFGRFSVSWDGRGRPGTRLSDWLDPIGSDATVLDGLDSSDISSTIETR